MRKMDLLGDDNQLLPTAVWEMWAHMLFNEDEVSLQQAITLVRMEYDRWSETKGENYQISALVESVLAPARERVAQRTVAGLVAIAMTALDNAGRGVSLESAAKIVSDCLNEPGNGSLPFLFLKGGEWSESEKRLVSDFATIKRYFRQNRSCAHLCAASVSLVEYLEPIKPFESSREVDGCIVATAIYYQARLKSARNYSDWNLWEIDVKEHQDKHIFSSTFSFRQLDRQSHQYLDFEIAKSRPGSL